MRARCLVCLLVTLLASAGCGRKPNLAGRWQGPLDLSPYTGGKPETSTFHVVIDIQSEEGRLAATYSAEDSPEGVPADSVELANGAVTVNISKRHEVFHGTISTDGTEIHGSLKHVPYDMPLNLKRTFGS